MCCVRIANKSFVSSFTLSSSFDFSADRHSSGVNAPGVISCLLGPLIPILLSNLLNNLDFFAGKLAAFSASNLSLVSCSGSTVLIYFFNMDERSILVSFLSVASIVFLSLYALRISCLRSQEITSFAALSHKYV